MRHAEAAEWPAQFPENEPETLEKQTFLAKSALQQIRSGAAEWRVRSVRLGILQACTCEIIGKTKQNEGFVRRVVVFPVGTPTGRRGGLNGPHRFQKMSQ